MGPIGHLFGLRNLLFSTKRHFECVHFVYVAGWVYNVRLIKYSYKNIFLLDVLGLKG